MNWFYEGGPFMYALLVLGILLSLPALLRLVLCKWTRFPGLFLASVAALLGVGILGTQSGLALAFEAIASASVESKVGLMEAGKEVARLPQTFAVLWVGFLVPFHLLAVVLGDAESPRWLTITGGLAGLVLVAGVALSGASSYVVYEQLRAAKSLLGGGSAEEMVAVSEKINTWLMVSRASAGITGFAGILCSLVLSVSGLAAGVQEMRKRHEVYRGPLIADDAAVAESAEPV